MVFICSEGGKKEKKENKKGQKEEKEKREKNETKQRRMCNTDCMQPTNPKIFTVWTSQKTVHPRSSLFTE